MRIVEHCIVDHSDMLSSISPLLAKAMSLKTVFLQDLSVAGSRWKPGGRGIHRDVRRGTLHPEGAGFKGSAKAHGDFKKRGAKLEPFAYVPLRKKKGTTVSYLSKQPYSVIDRLRDLCELLSVTHLNYARV